MPNQGVLQNCNGLSCSCTGTEEKSVDQETENRHFVVNGGINVDEFLYIAGTGAEEER